MAIIGTTGNDTLTGTTGADTIYGFAGNDSISGGDGNDQVYGNEGNDTLDGGAGHDSIYGGTGTDILIGGDGNDKLFKLSLDGNGWFSGGAGDDTILGGSGNDTIDGGLGNDSRLEGYAGNDSISGGDGNDQVYGNEGNDTLDGGAGVNELYGGDGNDVYYISSDTTYIDDSAGTDTAYVSASFVKVPSSIENVNYINGAQALPYWIDALLPDRAAGLAFLSLLGGTKTFNYTFPTSIPAYNTSARDADGWTAMTSTQQSRIKLALTNISSVLGLSLTQTAVADASNTITFANNTQPDSGGYAKYPSADSSGSDLFLSTRPPNHATLQDGTESALVIMHEIGHSLGLEHPFVDGAAVPPYLTGVENSSTWTLMSYTNYPAQYYLQFSALDIAALQYLYGPSLTVRTSDDIYQVSATTSNFIWDGAGTDTITLANVSQAATVYLTPGYWGYVGTKSSLITAAGQVTVNFGTVIEQLVGSAQSDDLFGNDVNNTIDGGAGNDRIEGWGGDDGLIGSQGNDTLAGGVGNDSLDGGAGTDIALYSGNCASYTTAKTAAGWTVSSATDGLDTLANIERLKFADTAIAFDTSGVGGQTYRVYKAAFNRTPDVGGLGFWISGMDGGESLNAVAQGFVNSAEFKTVYGTSPTNAQIVTRFYDNVLGRAADSGGYNYWLGILDSGNANVAQVLASFSESPENQAAVIGVIGNGILYTPYG